MNPSAKDKARVSLSRISMLKEVTFRRPKAKKWKKTVRKSSTIPVLDKKMLANRRKRSIQGMPTTVLKELHNHLKEDRLKFGKRTSSIKVNL